MAFYIGADQEADTYEQVHKICFQDYHTVDIGQWDPPISPSHASPLAKWYQSTLVGKAARKDYNPLRLEDALRSLSGARPVKGVCAEDAALHCLVDIFERTPDDENSWDPDSYDPKAKSELAKAHSIAAYAYYRKYMARTTPIAKIGKRDALAPDDPLAFLLDAARHASHAAAVQLLTPAVLLAGFALRTCILDMPLVSPSHLNLYFLQFRPLWRALERCGKRWPARPPADDEDPPPAYDACAAEECEAAVVVGPRLAEHYSGCPDCIGETDEAPFYCSRECRDQDWATHQGTCQAPGRLRGPIMANQARRVQQRNTLNEMSGRVESYTHYEVVPDDSEAENTGPLCGFVEWSRSLPCPLDTPWKTVTVVKRTYRFQEGVESPR
ncbi:uncharacterized protein TRAVEDRAFT_51276 [Trametes versicolor FP-101664 SS1]|uniref:uncharacterized protein n=1 Tax=Trametes versicolor (strain FP-101664) TaxID=717944 RepID=UPI0004621F3D|nr:uncharacterized protein TRAVEDRAFT_51276 [Trametes versicolor FP-101664 SS1]EIW55148.1 hypothetical protein TRAVEDRAFT_51276 [Trametes versicolor FP-101664 SS1]